MGRKEEFVKIGPLGDGEVAKYRWSKLASYLEDCSVKSSVEIDDNFISIEFDSLETSLSQSYYSKVLSIFSEGVNGFDCEDFSLNLDQKTLHLYLSELSAIRKLWILVEQLILTGI